MSGKPSLSEDPVTFLASKSTKSGGTQEKNQAYG